MLLTKIYCHVDDFCKKHEKYLETMNLSYGMDKAKGVRKTFPMGRPGGSSLHIK